MPDTACFIKIHHIYGSILYHLRDKAIYWSKIAIISYSFDFDARLGGPRQNIAITFGTDKNLAIANRSRVSCAHNMPRPTMITP